MKELIELRKLSQNLVFTEHNHSYINVNTKKRYLSVSALKKAVSQPFDDEYWTMYKALQASGFIVKFIPGNQEKRLINVNGSNVRLDVLKTYDLTTTPLDLKKAWDEEAIKGKTRGSELHLVYEQYKQRKVTDQKFYKTAEKVKQSDRYVVAQEIIVADDELMIAGTIDEIEINSNLDWFLEDLKTDKEIKTSNKFQKFKDPLSHLEDCNFNTYAVQLNLYAYIVEKNTSIRFKGFNINHLSEDGIVKYSVPRLNLTDEIVRRIIDLAKSN